MRFERQPVAVNLAVGDVRVPVGRLDGTVSTAPLTLKWNTRSTSPFGVLIEPSQRPLRSAAARLTPADNSSKPIASSVRRIIVPPLPNANFLAAPE